MDAHRNRGVALVIVLWMLVAMAVAAGLLIAWSRERVAGALAARADVQDRIDMIGTRDTLLFLAATAPMTRAGLPQAPADATLVARRRLDEFGGLDKTPRGSELPLDGAPFRGLGEVVVSVQDEAGLVPLAIASGPGLDAMLALLEVPRTRRSGFVDALADYVDRDDLRRLNGAESRQYERSGLAPPAGRPLLLPSELTRVHGWHRLGPPQSGSAIALSTTAYSGAMNLNTAPLPLLSTLAERCLERCLERIRQRRTSPFVNALEFERDTGATLPGDRDVDFRTSPSDALRMTLAGRSGRAWRMHVRLTPLADRTGPWSVEAAYRVPRPPSDDAPGPIPSPLFAPPPMD